MTLAIRTHFENPLQAYLSGKSTQNTSLIHRIREYIRSNSLFGAKVAIGTIGGIAISGVIAGTIGATSGAVIGAARTFLGAETASGAISAAAASGATASAVFATILGASYAFLVAKGEDPALIQATRLVGENGPLVVQIIGGAAGAIGCLNASAVIGAIAGIVGIGPESIKSIIGISPTVAMVFVIATARVAIEKKERMRESRLHNFNFFSALLHNFLESFADKVKKEEFLDDYKSWLRGAPALLARSFVAQLVDTRDELTMDNTPDFFHIKRTIEGREITLLDAVNELKMEIYGDQKKAIEGLSKEAKDQIDFLKEKYVPRDAKARVIQSRARVIANCMEQAWEINEEGVRVNPMMPNAREIDRFSQTYFRESHS